MLSTQPSKQAAVYASCLPPDCPQSLLDEFARDQVSIREARERYATWKRGSLRQSRIVAMTEVNSDGHAGHNGQTFESVVEHLMATRGLSRREACRIAAKNHRDLHEDYINRNQLSPRGDNP